MRESEMTPGEMRKRLDRLKKLATLLDAAVGIPFTGQRVGVDSLIGLIPVVGDFGSGLAGLYIVNEARNFGTPGRVLALMLLNLLVDAAVGSIPILGDLFDIGFKANLRNVALLERWLESASRQTAS